MECAFLNNPEISGNKAPAGAPTVTGVTPPATAPGVSIPGAPIPGGPPSTSPAAEGVLDYRGATLVTSDPVLENVAPAPIAPPNPVVPVPPAVVAPVLIILTGRTGVGKSFLAQRSGAVVMELDDPIRNIAKKVLGHIADGPQADSLVDTIFQWGNGQVNTQYPLTPARLLFSACSLAGMPQDYGSPGCWVRDLIDRAKRFSEVGGHQIIVTGVSSVDDFKALVAAGFRHYHVVCSAASYTSRPKRKNASDQLAAALDKDISLKLSQQRQGDRLRCIWSDAGVPHPRLFSVDQWLQAISIQPTAEFNPALE